LFSPEGGLLKEGNTESILKYVEDLEQVNEQLVVNLLKRIALLENINGNLATDLRCCIGLLKVFKETVPNPEEWQDMLNTLEANLKTVKTVQEERMFNQTGLLGMS
jgi:hypothetical protein